MKYRVRSILAFGLVTMVACSKAQPPATDAAAQPGTTAISAAQPSSLFELRLVATSVDLPRYPLEDGTTLPLEKEVVASAKDVESVRQEGTTVFVALGPAGAKALKDVTARHRGERLAIVVDGRVNAAPVIKAEIDGGSLSFDMKNADDAKAIAARLRPTP